MAIIPFKSTHPSFSEKYFVAPDAWIIGDVAIQKRVSIFFGAVLRGDIKAIRVGEGTNIQEQALLHTSTGLTDCIVGNEVTVGHRAILHGCTVEDCCIIGMGSTVLDGAVIGKESIVGAQALVPMNMKVPPRSLVLGVPAKVVRTLSDEEVSQLRVSALHYQELGAYYSKKLSTTAVARHGTL